MAQQPKRTGKARVRIRAMRRAEPDLPKLSRALIALALAQAEQAAQADHETQQGGDPPASEASS